MHDVKYLIEKAREADQLAAGEEDPEVRDDWIKIAAFWLGLAERAMELNSQGLRPLCDYMLH